jgi:hypothetical protein
MFKAKLGIFLEEWFNRDVIRSSITFNEKAGKVTMSKKFLIWVSIVAIVLVWVIQRQQNEQENEQTQLNVEKSLAAELKQEMDESGRLFAHEMYQKSICDLKLEFTPIKNVQMSISKKTAIPPDLNSELRTFSDSLNFKTDNPELLFPKGEKLSPVEQSISLQLSKLAVGLKVKVAELEQNMVSYTDPYFKDLEKNVLNISDSGCRLYYQTKPEKNPDLVNKTEISTKRPSIQDETLELVGKRVAYKSVCDFREKAVRIDQAIIDVRTSQAFKNILLDEILAVITSLKYSPFLFGSNFLYEPTEDELFWEEESKTLMNQFEVNRYKYWTTPTNSNLEKILSTSRELKKLGKLGCVKLELLDKK